MPATALALGRLLQALGFKQQETWPMVEAVQPVALVGDWTSLVPNPRGPESWIGGVGPAGLSSLDLVVTAAGGAWVDAWVGTTFASASPIAFDLSALPRTPIVGESTAGQLVTSDPGGVSPTTVGIIADALPIGANSPQVVVGPSDSSINVGPFYVPPGNFLRIAGATLYWNCRVREIPEAHPAR